jgi:Tfp pilus assembly protein PilV
MIVHLKMNNKGFTLVEILVTIGIIIIGVLIIAKSFNVGVLVQSDAENVTRALNIAQAKIEEIKVTPYGSLADSGPTQDPDFSNFNVTVDVAEGQSPMPIYVIVAWQTKGGQADVTLTTYKADY